MSEVFDPVGDDALTNSLTGPSSSIEIRGVSSAAVTGLVAGTPIPAPAAQPLALRNLRSAPAREIPEYVYDRVRQVATDQRGRPLVPDLKKDWTTIEGTHTDGDGGDNEMWEWEETR